MGRELPPPAWISPRPTPPQSEPEEPRSQSLLSYWLFSFALVVGLVLGLGASWTLGPLPERNTEPFQLKDEDRNHYLIAIALEYEHTGDLHRALDKLVALRPLGDPLQALADAACELAKGEYLGSETGVRALRMAARMYTAQGRSGCAEALLPAEDPPDKPAAAPDPAAPPPSPRHPLPRPRPGAPAEPPPPCAQSPPQSRRGSSHPCRPAPSAIPPIGR